MNKKDLHAAVTRYSERLEKFGYSEEALGWSKNKNKLRFSTLISEWKDELHGSSICDFGCGFGDFYFFLKKDEKIRDFSYLGVDINSDLIEEGKKHYPEAEFWVGDMVSEAFERKFDFAFSSGVFNHKLNFQDEYHFIEECLDKLNQISTKGYAVNFLSDKVDFQLEHTFHSNPGKILEMAFRHSKNIVLRNDYMPFEFTIFVRKDIKIDTDKVVFEKISVDKSINQ